MRKKNRTGTGSSAREQHFIYDSSLQAIYSQISLIDNLVSVSAVHKFSPGNKISLYVQISSNAFKAQKKFAKKCLVNRQ